MATTFYVVMLKRKDGAEYADLHKTDQRFYLDKFDANVALSEKEEKEHFHVVPLVALTEKEWKEIGGK